MRITLTYVVIFALFLSACGTAHTTDPNVFIEAPTSKNVGETKVGLSGNTIPLSVSISSPANGTVYVTGPTVTFSASVSGNVGVTTVEYYDGGVFKGSASSSPYNFNWPIASSRNGTHNWTAKVYDATGSPATSTPVTITVNIPVTDTTLPLVSISSPANGANYVSAQTVTFSAFASDNVGVTVVEFYDGGVFKGSDSSSPYNFNWTIARSRNGTHSWTAKAYDDAGNTATSTPVNIIVNIPVTDTSAPLVSISSPANGTNYVSAQTVTISASASDNSGVVSRVEFYDGGVLKAAMTAGPYNYAWSITSSLNGTHSWTAKAYDAAGNNTTSSAVGLSVNIASVAPGLHLWSKDFGGTDQYATARGKSVAIDAQGNIFVTGGFTGVVDFGGITRQTVSTDYDVFVMKYSSAGALQWVNRFGGSNLDEGLKLALDANGDVLVVGYFWGTSDLGGGPIANAGYSDGFVAKYSGVDGRHIWSRGFGGTNQDSAYGVATDTGGNVYVTGSFQGTADFGKGPLTSVAGSKDLFLAKYSASGTPIWSKPLGGTYDDSSESVAVDGSGNILLIGQFQGSVDFGGGALVSAGGNDIFLAKFSSAGSHIWSKRFGDSNGETVHSVAAAANGDIVMSGEFRGTIDFGSGVLTNVGSGDIFLAAFDASGGSRWSKQFGTSNTFGATGKAVAMDSAGNVALTGVILDLVDFGNGLLGPTGSNDPIIAKFTSAGAPLWSKRFTGPYGDEGLGIAMDAVGNVVITGDFYESMDFGGGPLLSPWPTGTDGFVAKYAP